MTNNSPETGRKVEALRENIKYYTSLSYRTSMAERLAKNTKTSFILACDDVGLAVPEPQRPLLSALPGYERGTLPGLLLSLGFENGGATLVLAPPNPVEMRQFIEIYKSLNNPPFSILWENPETGKLINLLTLSNDEYRVLCRQYAGGRYRPRDSSPRNHLNIMERHANELFRYPTFVFPFQMTQEHSTTLSNIEVNVPLVSPDIPNIDKVWNNFYLRKMGLGKYLPLLIGVTPEGKVITSLDEYNQSLSEPVLATEENIKLWVNSILEALQYFKNLVGRPAYVKLDSLGVSGLGNFPPHVYPWLYDDNTSEGKKREELTKIIRKLYPPNNYLPRYTVIEELITPKIVSGVKPDYIVVGMVIDGEVYPTGIFPFAVDEHDEYIGEWAVRDPVKINEYPQVWEELLNLYKKVGNALAETGYRNGIIAFDVFAFVTDQGEIRIYVHDYNFRRGGRTFSEALLPLLELPRLQDNDGYFNVEVKFPLPGVLTDEQAFEIYTQVCEKLAAQGAFVYSTAFGYYAKEGGKLKALYPLNNLTGERESHVTQVYNFVKNCLSGNIDELK